jgi:NAD-dependent protein deacetylases, SIR2 family
MPRVEGSARAQDSHLTSAARHLRKASRIVVFTGAGISAESGLGTYRTGDSALWSEENMQRYANPRGFRRHAAEAWPWYDARRQAMLAAQPNAGHRALVDISRHVPQTLVFTQNIDRLHQRAGSPDVWELHGSLDHAKCFDCERPHSWPQTFALENVRCQSCGGLLRPDVVLFEEFLDEKIIESAMTEAARCDVLLSIGTSNQVQPAASIPWIAADHGIPVIVINADITGQEKGRTILHIEGKAAEVLPELVALAWPAPPAGSIA